MRPRVNWALSGRRARRGGGCGSHRCDGDGPGPQTRQKTCSSLGHEPKWMRRRGRFTSCPDRRFTSAPLPRSTDANAVHRRCEGTRGAVAPMAGPASQVKVLRPPRCATDIPVFPCPALLSRGRCRFVPPPFYCRPCFLMLARRGEARSAAHDVCAAACSAYTCVLPVPDHSNGARQKRRYASPPLHDLKAPAATSKVRWAR